MPDLNLSRNIKQEIEGMKFGKNAGLELVHMNRQGIGKGEIETSRARNRSKQRKNTITGVRWKIPTRS